MSFSVGYPFWFILLSVLLSGGLSWLLYKNNPLKLQLKWVNYVLILLRFIVLFFVCFLLLGPLINLNNRKIEKPVVVIAVDNSNSIVLNKDSAFYKTDFLTSLNNLVNTLSTNYEVKFWQFGNQVKPSENISFTEQETNIANVFTEAKNQFENLNLGAIVLASDGIYNKGENPEYTVNNINVPVYTIALGDSNQYKDILITNVKHNAVVFEGNGFNIVAEINAFSLANNNANVWVEHNGKTIAKQTVKINSNNSFIQQTLLLNADKEGLQTYTVNVQQFIGEVSLANNQYQIQVNVLKSKQKVKLVALAPNPDLTAIKQALQNNANLDVDINYYNKVSTKDLQQADMVIFHQIPGNRGEGFNLAQFVWQNAIPVLNIVGSNSNVNVFNQLTTNFKVTGNGANFNNAQAIFNNNFNLFLVEPNLYESFNKFPPLITPYVNYNLPADAQVLFEQQIGYVKTNNPLVFFTKNATSYAGFILGEGFWRWRLHDYLLNNNHIATNDFLNKCVQLIAGKNDKSKLRIKPAQQKFYTTDDIVLEAEFYNEANELDNAGDLEITILNNSNKSYKYNFSKQGNGYILNAGNLPQGRYTFSAKHGNYTKQGSFNIILQVAEYLTTKANHQLLNNISAKTNGSLLFANQINLLPDLLEKNNQIKPVIYNNKQVKELLHLKWLFALFIILLSTEWFIRKYNGFI